MDKKAIVLPGRDKSIRHRHHWIFSGAIQSLPKFENGEILPVFSSRGEFLGSGYFNRNASIIGRMIAFDQTPPLEAIERSIHQALSMRSFFFNEQTNAYRLVNGEGDCLPGLIVDRYDNVLVIQMSTLGMERIKAQIVDYLIKQLHPQCIYEKSLLPSRKEEGLGDVQGVLHGTLPEELVVLENGLRFAVSIEEGQKTGFFLDQREARQLIQQLGCKKVLNCFGYTGGFSVYALAGGAIEVDTVDISAKALELAQRNFELNHFDPSKHGFFDEDVFSFLRERALQYDLVILDPPAFAKKKKDIIPACRGYKEINRVAMKTMPHGSLLFTCSCSYFVDEALFQKVLFQAASEAKRDVKIIGRHRLAKDHPINIFHPEGSYLKGFLLYISL